MKLKRIPVENADRSVMVKEMFSARGHGFSLWGASFYRLFRADHIANSIACDMLAVMPTNTTGFPQSMTQDLFNACLNNLEGHSIKLIKSK